MKYVPWAQRTTKQEEEALEEAKESKSKAVKVDMKELQKVRVGYD